MAEPRRPYSRSEYNRALILNALTQPFNVLLLAAVLIAGLLLDAFLPVLAVGLVAYGIAAARTYFDQDERTRSWSARRPSDARRSRPDGSTRARCPSRSPAC
jgi:hypothetical protein